jgi:hypothetical protein
VGVAQIINKNPGGVPFTREDEKVITIIEYHHDYCYIGKHEWHSGENAISPGLWFSSICKNQLEILIRSLNEHTHLNEIFIYASHQLIYLI